MTDNEETPQGIRFDRGIKCSKGTLFILLPVKGLHSQADIIKAKKYLNNTFDVDRISIHLQGLK